MPPDGFAELQIHQLDVEIQPGNHAASAHFAKRIEMADQTEFGAAVAAQRRNAFEMPRGTKSTASASCNSSTGGSTQR